MRKSLLAILILICASALTIIYLRLSSAPRLSDDEQIQALLAEGEIAIENKNIRQAMSLVSADYKDSAGFTYQTLRLEAMQAFRNADGFDVILEHPRMQINRDFASVEIDVTITAITNGQRHNVFSSPINLSLRREKQTRYLFFHMPKWRITSMSIEDVMPEF
ncbi:MAG: hypothetical protein QME62_03650 [Armatimonadota bacterium]|nr:hypothetical protein [Armatimonadota bacterium]